MIAYILNIFDLFATYYILDIGGMELNPIVRGMMGVHPLLFPVCKFFLAGVLIRWLHKQAKTHKQAKSGLAIVTVYYAALAVWHIINIFGGFL